MLTNAPRWALDDPRRRWLAAALPVVGLLGLLGLAGWLVWRMRA